MIKKSLIVVASLMLCLVLTGCSTGTQQQSNTANKLNTTINKLTETIKRVEVISNSELMINEIMGNNEEVILTSAPIRRNSQKQIVRYGKPNSGYNGATYTSRYVSTQPYSTYTSLGNYVNKLEDLHDVASNSMAINNDIQYLKSQILSKCSALQTLNNDIKSNKLTLTENQCKSIDDLLTNLNTYISRVNMSKNEVKNEVISVKKLKSNYANNVEQLSSKYTRLANCLDTRCSYYSNIIGCLDGIYGNIINGDMSGLLENYLKTQYSSDCDDPLCNECPDCKECPNGNGKICKDGICYEYKDGKCIDCYPEKLNNETVDSVTDVSAKDVKNNKNINTYSYGNIGYNGYNGGLYENGLYGAGYGYNNGMWRNINTYRSIRNIDTMDREANDRIKNTDTFKDINTNIDTFKGAKNDNSVKKNYAKNTQDPYKVMPDMKTSAKEYENDSEIKTLKTTDVYYGESPFATPNHSGYFRIRKIETKNANQNNTDKKQEIVENKTAKETSKIEETKKSA